MHSVGSSKLLWTEENLQKTIVLVDMDCFYVQVEQRLNPELKDKPCAVVQYNDWKGGGIIAVDYIARSKGVKRNGMRGDDAIKLCPNINLCRVPEVNGKADLTRYRDACVEVINVLSQFGGRVERASVDEAYIDLTEVVERQIKNGKHNVEPNNLKNTFVEGWTNDDKGNKVRESGVNEWCKWLKSQDRNNCFVRLAIAAKIVEEIRAAVYQQTGFRCSAGISHNKMLAKLGCGLHKPNKQTIMPYTCIDKLFNRITIGKIRHLGGKLGVTLCEKFQVKEIGQVQNIPLVMLVETFGDKTGNWLYEVCRGIDKEEVKERHVPQSVGCGKTFAGQACLKTREKVALWCSNLMTELSERLFKDKAANNRVAKTLTASIKLDNGKTLSRSCTIFSYETKRLTKDLISVLQQLNKFDSRSPKWSPGILSLNVSAKNFSAISQSSSNFSTINKISQFMTNQTPSISSSLGCESSTIWKQSSITFTKSDNDCKIDKAFTKLFSPKSGQKYPKQVSEENNCTQFDVEPKLQKIAASSRALETKFQSETSQLFGVESKEFPPEYMHSKSANIYSKNQSSRNLCKIDMAFNLLFPAKEISSNSLKNTSSEINKKTPRKTNSKSSLAIIPTSNQTKRKNTILGFLSPNNKSTGATAMKKIKMDTELKHLGNPTCSTERKKLSNEIPLGFLHKKSKFADAVKNALGDNSMPVPVTGSIDMTTQRQVAHKDVLFDITNTEVPTNDLVSYSGSKFSLWSDFSDTEFYCEKCQIQISPWEAPEHKSFHYAMESGNIP